LANVSPATVSRVAKGHLNVDPAMRTRVRRAAESLGIDLDQKRNEKSSIIGFLLSNRDLLHTFQARILCAAEAYCASQNRELLFVSMRYSPVVPADQLHLPKVLTDHEFNTKHKIYGSTIVSYRPAMKSIASGVSGPADDFNLQHLNSYLARLAEDWTVSPQTLNHFGASLNYIWTTNISTRYGQGWPQKLGLTGVQGDFFPTVTFNQGYATLGDNNATLGALHIGAVLQDTLTLIRGKHALKIGVEIIRRTESSEQASSTGGTFAFSNLETALPGVSTTGNSVASFLLGQVDSASALFRGVEGTALRFWDDGVFIQDDFTVTHNLTLNLGLRWELQTPFVDPGNRLSYMDPSLPNPGAGNLPGAYTFAGSGPGRSGWSSLANTDWKNFGPRVGFAYSPRGGWAVRGGYGLVYLNLSTSSIGATSSGFNNTASFSSANVGVTPAFDWDNGFPQNFAMPPLISPTVLNGQGAAMGLRSRDGEWPYNQQWNMTVEKQLGSMAAIRASYVGSKGTRLYAADATGWNQVNPSYLALGSVLTAQVGSPQAAGFGAPFPGFNTLWGGQATVAQALRRFPQFGSVGELSPDYGDSSYQSLQLFAQKRLSHGLVLNVAYTFSKSIDDTNGLSSGAGEQNYYNRRNGRSVSAWDLPQVLTISYVYALPFGPKQPFLVRHLAAELELYSLANGGIFQDGEGLRALRRATHAFHVSGNVAKRVRRRDGEAAPAVDERNRGLKWRV
jgi:Bacterial regulatory proteins, lacI family